MNGTHQALAYEDDVNLIGDIRTIERNSDVLLNACKDIGLAVKTGKNKNMEIGRQRGMIANKHILIGSNSYENVLLYGCESWSLTIREERRLRVFENRILRLIFGSERDENGE